jgi:hypothetical protein
MGVAGINMTPAVHLLYKHARDTPLLLGRGTKGTALAASKLSSSFYICDNCRAVNVGFVPTQ